MGIDQHKRFSQVVVKTETGQVLEERKLYHDDREGMRQFFRKYRESVGILEANRHWDWLWDLMEEELAEQKLSHPKKTRLIAEAKLKSDKVDGDALADLSRSGFLPEAYAPKREIRDARELHRYRIRLVRMQTRLKNQIHTILDRLGHQHPFTDLFGKRGWSYLEQLELREPYQKEKASLMRLLATVRAEIKIFQSEVKKHVQASEEGQRLMTAPGIAEILAYLILYEIGGIERFDSARRFSSYCCLVPSTRQSADHCHHGPVGKEGNQFLKWAFVEAAHPAIKGDPQLGALYNRVLRKQGPEKAYTAVAHQLAVSVYHMLTRKENYKPYTPKDKNGSIGQA
jgi:transposase